MPHPSVSECSLVPPSHYSLWSSMGSVMTLVSLGKTETYHAQYPVSRIGSLSNCIVPVLPKGAKTALCQPIGRWTKFRVWYNPYRQLFFIILVGNSICLLLASLNRFSYANTNASAFALGNILVAVSARNELFLRGIFWLCVTLFQKVCSHFRVLILRRPGSLSWKILTRLQWTPLWFRIALTAFLQHLGGVHGGAATSSLLWLLYALFRSVQNPHSTHVVVLAMSMTVTFLIIVSILSALPIVRHRHHNVFEHHHRFAGWAGLIFTWAFVVLGCMQTAVVAEGGEIVEWKWDAAALLHSQQFWFALLITILTFIPWVTVRKVPVEITTPSPRAALIKFERGIQQGLLGRISRDPVREYHGFGIISEGIKSGCHYMVVGVQGDWTRRIVSDPPTHLYTREMKFAGLPYLSSLYRKGIMICTGSGIGAVLSTCLQLDNWFLIWIGSGLEETFGAELMGIVKRGMLREEEGERKTYSRWQKDAQSGGVIQGRRCILFDTKKEGRRPDTVKMLKDVYAAFEAEVVIITSNPTGNAELMHACRENNIHSFGPLWDS